MADQERPRHVNLTREELYEKVWQSPMMHAAAEFGISGNGLAKICDRHKIPYPPRGYWAKKAAGKSVPQSPAPRITNTTLYSIVITRTPEPPSLPEDVKAKVEEAQTDLVPIEVSDKLLRPHPVIAGWLAERVEHNRKARQERGEWRSYSVRQWTELDHRSHLILDTLFKALEKRGAKIKESDRRELYAELGGEKIHLAIREKHKQIRRPPTDAEKKDRFFGSYRKVIQELQPTGRLLFAISTYLPHGLKREWLETEDKSLESLLPDIVATFVAAGPLLAAQTRERQEAERQRQIAAQKRHEEQQRRKQEANRFRRLTELANRSRQLVIAREFLERLKTGEFDPALEIDGRSAEAWLQWAEDYAAEIDPLKAGAEDVFRQIAEVKAWSYTD